MNFIGLFGGRNEVARTKQLGQYVAAERGGRGGAKALGSSSSFAPTYCVTLDRLLAISGLQSLLKIISTIISASPAGYEQLRLCGEDCSSSSWLSRGAVDRLLLVEVRS